MDKMVALDAYDLKILEAFATKGAVRNIDIAETIGLSPSACHQRTAKLKKIGVLKGFIIDADTTLLGSYTRILTLVMLKNQDQAKFKILNKKLRAIPSVVRAHRIAGDFDYVFETLAPDFESYRVIVEGVMAELEIKQYQSRIMQESIKATTDINAILSWYSNF